MKNNLLILFLPFVLYYNLTSHAEDDIKNKIEIIVGAQRLFDSGDGDLAVSKLNSITDNIQNRGLYWDTAVSEKIRILSAMGRFTDAIGFGDACVAKGATSDNFFLAYGSLLFDCGIYKKSLSMYNKIKDGAKIDALKDNIKESLFATGDLDGLMSIFNERPIVDRTLIDGIKKAINFSKNKQETLSSTFEYLIIDHNFKSINEPLREYLSKAFLSIESNLYGLYFSELLKHRILFILRNVDNIEHISDLNYLFTSSSDSIGEIKKYISVRILRGRSKQ